MRLLLCAAFTLGGLLPAQAQDVRLTTRLGVSLAHTITALADSAAGQGLPREPLVQKALEGASKGANAEQIIDASRRLARGMGKARAVFGPAAAEEILVAAAVALRLGIAEHALERFRETARGLKLQAGLTLAVDLIERGVRPETSAALVETALASSLAAPDVLGMRQVIERDIRSGMVPNRAATLRARAVSAAERL